MKKIIIFLLIILNGCSKDSELSNELYMCNGIPSENQSFSAMYFIDENEGYLFGTYSNFSDMTDNNLDDPTFTPQFVQEATVYKTEDGGLNWEKIDSELDKEYSPISIQENNAVYIVLKDSKENFKSNIVKISLPNIRKVKSRNIETISALWMNYNDDYIYYSNNRGNLSLFKLNSNLVYEESLSIPKYLLKGSSNGNMILGLFADHESSYFGYLDERNDYNEISLPIIPKDFIVTSKGSAFVIGNTKNIKDQISILKYDIESKSIDKISEFKGYSIAQGFYSNDKIMVAFVGNISGAFTKYDLIFSKDNGLSWEVKKLSEGNYVRPSCLINNILYIYSGGSRMQKIVF